MILTKVNVREMCIVVPGKLTKSSSKYCAATFNLNININRVKYVGGLVYFLFFDTRQDSLY